MDEDEKMYFVTNPGKVYTKPLNPDKNYFIVGKKVITEYDPKEEEENDEDEQQQEAPNKLPNVGPKEFDIEEEILKGTDLLVIDFILSIIILLILID